MTHQPYRQRLAEGLVFIAIGAFILIVLPYEIRVTPALQTQTSPKFIPRVVSVSMIVVGLAMGVTAFLGKVKDKPADLSKTGILRAVISMLLLLAYTVLFPRVGFVVTSVVFFAVFAWIFGARSPVRMALSSVGVSVAVWLLFEHLFRVPLPHGFLY